MGLTSQLGSGSSGLFRTAGGLVDNIVNLMDVCGDLTGGGSLLFGGSGDLADLY